MPLLKLENGISVSYLSYPDERPSPSRPTFTYQLQDERFKGFNFVGVDVHGHGDTVGRENWDYVDNANDVVEALTVLDVDKFFVLGMTHGGLTAQEITLRHPERVRGMVLVGSTSRPYGDAIASQCRDVLVPAWMSSTPPSDLAVQGPLLLTVGVAAKPAEASGSVFGDRAVGPTVLQGAERTAESVVGIELLSRIVDNFRAHTGEAKVMKPVEVMLNWHGSESRLRNVKVPVLVIHGLDDPFLPFERSKQIVSLLPEHPLTRLVEMDGKGSHVLNVVLDIIPEFNARLSGWLDEAIQAGL